MICSNLEKRSSVSFVDRATLAAWKTRAARDTWWRGFVVKNLGWFLALIAWVVGAWVVLAYGVLIYTYLGEGEESVKQPFR
jgi:hypothetical protein